MDKKEILNQFYKLFRHQLSIEDFELWIDKEKWPIVINRSKPKIKSEATRLLGFLESGEIQITGDHEYKDNRSFNDRIELHSVEKMYLSDCEIES